MVCGSGKPLNSVGHRYEPMPVDQHQKKRWNKIVQWNMHVRLAVALTCKTTYGYAHIMSTQVTFESYITSTFSKLALLGGLHA